MPLSVHNAKMQQIPRPKIVLQTEFGIYFKSEEEKRVNSERFFTIKGLFSGKIQISMADGRLKNVEQKRSRGRARQKNKLVISTSHFLRDKKRGGTPKISSSFSISFPSA